MNDGTFVIGEIAIFQNLPHPFSCANGDECEIVGGNQPREVVDIMATIDVVTTYAVKYHGLLCAVCLHNLKKKPKGKDTAYDHIAAWHAMATFPGELVEA